MEVLLKTHRSILLHPSPGMLLNCSQLAYLSIKNSATIPGIEYDRISVKCLPSRLFSAQLPLSHHQFVIYS